MSKNQKIEPGAEILSFCGKCKLPLAHTIMAMKKNGTVGKCQCKTCEALHLYRDPEKVKASKTTKTKESKQSRAESAWKKAIAKASGQSKAYAMTGEFAMGALIEHSTFGKGVVEESIAPNKIRVVFESGEKILIHKQD